MRWKILGALLNAYWVYSVGSVSKMWLVLSITFLFSLQYVELYVLEQHIQDYVIDKIYLQLILLSSSNRKYQPYTSL